MFNRLPASTAPVEGGAFWEGAPAGARLSPVSQPRPIPPVRCEFCRSELEQQRVFGAPYWDAKEPLPGVPLRRDCPSRPIPGTRQFGGHIPMATA